MSNPDLHQDDRAAAGPTPREELLRAVPLDEQRLVLAGIPTAVLVGGEGPPMVLLHGPGEFAFVWLRVLPDLASTHRLVVPDLPGHGATGLGSAPLDGERTLAWLDALIDETCASPPVLVGHLLGGALAARYSVVHPDRVGEVVLVDTLGLRRFRPTPAFTLTMLAFLARPSDRSRDRFFRQCFVDFDGVQAQLGQVWKPLMAYALERAKSPDQKVGVRSLLRDFGSRAIAEEELARISVPTRLVWGRHDRQTPIGVAERASVRFGWPLHVIEGAADDPAFEQPEALVAAVAAAS